MLLLEKRVKPEIKCKKEKKMYEKVMNVENNDIIKNGSVYMVLSLQCVQSRFDSQTSCKCAM